MATVKPISPDEVVTQKRADIPDAVIECWNRAIAENWTGHGFITIFQNDIVRDIVAATSSHSSEVIGNGWLDIEPIYRDNGWVVNYNKPAYDESYEPFFQFDKK